MNLSGKKALVTGAGRGIGRAIALAFAQAGCDVALAARSEAELAETAAQVQAAGAHALALPCDVARPEDIARTVEATLREFGHIDLLVNNAGYAHFRPVLEISLEEWQRMMDVNLTAPFLFIQAVLPSMMARREGRILNISSVAGVKPYLHQSGYCASKHGLNGLTASLALELKEHNIAIHSVCPGGVPTRLTEEAMPDRDKSDWMAPEDIAHACLYLATLSPRATTDLMVVRRFTSTP